MYPFLGISCKPCIDWRCPTLERILLLFSHERPCWDEETLALSGEDPHALRELEDSGDLMRIAASYGLTPQGVRTRERVAQELCVPVSSAGEVLVDEVRAREMLERNRLEQFLDRAFMTDWGIKEVSVGETFAVVPCLPDDEYFALSDGRVRALWPRTRSNRRSNGTRPPENRDPALTSHPAQCITG